MKHIIIFLVIIVLLFLYHRSDDLNEGWQSYTMDPFGYVTTGSSPPSYYRHDIYRLPYNYPFTFHNSYPHHHESYLL